MLIKNIKLFIIQGMILTCLGILGIILIPMAGLRILYLFPLLVGILMLNKAIHY
jgi:hypothetical protein